MRYDIITEAQLDEFVKAKEFYRVVLFRQRHMDGRENDWWAIQRVKPEKILVFGDNGEVDVDDSVDEKYDEDGTHTMARDVYVVDDLREAWQFYCDKKLEQFNKKIAELEKERQSIENDRNLDDIESIKAQMAFWAYDDDDDDE